MDNRKLEKENALVISYLALRKAIGLLGIALPFVVSLGALILFQTNLQSSVSSYYYTGMRDVFVGALWATGFFLFSYKGYERSDEIAGDLACVFAIGVALFPTTPDATVASGNSLIGSIHAIFAALFFLTLIYFSVFLFTKTKKNGSMSNGKRQRNRVYRACGAIMLICILLIAIYFIFPNIGTPLKPYGPVFWLEAVADLAFGISWFLKGAVILQQDEGILEGLKEKLNQQFMPTSRR